VNAAINNDDDSVSNYSEEGGSGSDKDKQEHEEPDDLKDLLNEKKVSLMTPQSAFITFKNPFAAFLSKKMMK